MDNKYIYVYAYDPVADRRVPHVILGDKAISLVTGVSFAVGFNSVKEDE